MKWIKGPLATLAAAAVLLTSRPAPTLASDFLSLQWTDRPVCVLLGDCEREWRLRVQYRAEWQPQFSWAPTLYTDGDVLVASGREEALHIKPVFGWFGGGLGWHVGDLWLGVGGVSGHFFDRRPDLVTPDGTGYFTGALATYNYLEVRWGRR